MYSLEIFVVFVGHPRVPARARVADGSAASRSSACSSRSCSTRSTGRFYLLLVVGVLLVGASRGPRSTAARRMRLADGDRGRCRAFVPWLPTFLYQVRTRVRRGAARSFPATRSATPCATSRAATSKKAGPAARAAPARRSSASSAPRSTGASIELDLRTQPGARWEAIVGRRTLVVGLTLNYSRGTARSSRATASMVFPFFVVLVARGVTTFADPRVARRGVVVGRRGSVSSAPGATWSPTARRPAGRRGPARRGQARRRRGVLPRSARPGRAPARATGARRGDVSRRSDRRRSSTGSTTRRSSPSTRRPRSRRRCSHSPGTARSGSCRRPVTGPTSRRATPRSPTTWPRPARSGSGSLPTTTSSRNPAPSLALDS